MGSLIFICPTSSQEVSTGLEMDLASFRALPLIAEIKCPACGLTHNLFQVGARNDGSEPRDASPAAADETQKARLPTAMPSGRQ
jgi:hypothetical protein